MFASFQVLVPSIVTVSGTAAYVRYKKLYIALFSGFLFNVIMNIPFMVLFHKIGLTIYYGNLVATMIGFGITIILCLIDLKREFKVNYSETFKRWLYIIFSVIIMVVVLKCLNIVLPINGYGRAMSILITGVYSFIGMIIYFGLTYKLQLFQNIIGVDFIKNLGFEEIVIPSQTYLVFKTEKKKENE